MPKITEIYKYYGILAKERIIKSNVNILLYARRAYYLPEHPAVDLDKDSIPDSSYDALEKGIFKMDPTHPILEAVGWDDLQIEYLNYRSPEYLQNIKEIEKFSKQYPYFNWSLDYSKYLPKRKFIHA